MQRCKGPTFPAHPQAGQARPVLRPGLGFTRHDGKLGGSRGSGEDDLILRFGSIALAAAGRLRGLEGAWRKEEERQEERTAVVQAGR